MLFLILIYFTLTNSIISGFSPFALLEANIGTDAANLSKITLKNLVVNNCNGGITSESTSNNSGLESYYAKPEFNIDFTKIKNSDLFSMPNIKGNPDFRINQNNTIAIGN